ncbi:MAG: hypothetical protein JU82_09070 [Sulfuricurvum sp. MLSB]|uniref:hypothetical protein n=1 Tax=Sulfuricurvum sp. MLSB TaxID=1537917 RepID=UPI00050055BB|nr:hypothetical protein [Sulfuricurvum sp. MLSB]KFN39006.1 MAG: hypothetical protein JU82_09070 [Sulfuricurvum sp. MLSB]
MKISFFKRRFADQNFLSLTIFQLLDSHIDPLDKHETIIFDFSECTFLFDVNFAELFSKYSTGYIYAYKYSKKISLINEIVSSVKVLEDISTHPQSSNSLIFNFNNATFKGYPKFDFLCCSELHFKNTIFHKGALLRHLDIQYVLYEPRLLGADATFYHRKKADLAAGILRGKELGKIAVFHYRHALEGSGFTFLIGVKFTKEARFTDAVLDRVQFSHLNEETLSKCFFANSMLEETKFYNCHFPYHQNSWTIFDKEGWYKRPLLILILSLLIFVALCMYSPYFAIAGAAVINAFVFMPLMSALSKISFLNLNKHIAIGDDIKISKVQKSVDAESNYHAIREIYRQLRVNFEKHGDYQTAGEFYYSQRYTELLTFGSKFNRSFWQWNLLSIHHIVNGFGERWIRSLGWFLMTWIGFAFLTQPNLDFISSKSTPEYFFNVYKDNRDKKLTYNLSFDENNLTDEMNQPKHFILLVKTNYEDGNSTYYYKAPKLTEEKNSTKRIFAFDNRFDYAFTEQYIPMLRDDYTTKLAYSLTKMVSPFMSEEKNWFTPRSKDAHLLGIFESVLLWFFFGAFVLAVKNKIKR